MVISTVPCFIFGNMSLLWQSLQLRSCSLCIEPSKMTVPIGLLLNSIVFLAETAKAAPVLRNRATTIRQVTFCIGFPPGTSRGYRVLGRRSYCNSLSALCNGTILFVGPYSLG